MRVLIVITLLTAVAAPRAHAADEVQPKLRKALVSLQVTTQSWDTSEPWKKRRVNTRTGRGVMIRPGVILTLANVVRDQLQIEVSAYGSARSYPARLQHVDSRIGLALVQITDEKLNAQLEPMTLGDSVKLDDEFNIWELNSDNLLQRAKARVVRAQASSTRLTLRVNTTSSETGNGQVAVRAGKVVGLLIGSIRRQEGTILSVETIRHYLDGFTDDGYKELPGSCIWIQPLLREDLRRYYGLTEKQHGIAIRRVMPGSSADGVMQPGDVLLGVDGYDLDDEGQFIHETHGRLRTGYLLQGRRYVGDKVKLRMLRGGKEIDLEMTLKGQSAARELVPQRHAGTRPQFLVVGGLVVLELTDQIGISRSTGGVILRRYSDRDTWDPMGERRRVVFVDHVLRDTSNKGFETLRQRPIVSVNDKPIAEIADVATALESRKEGFHVFRFEGVETDFVVPVDKLGEINARIAERYKVTRERYLLGDAE